MYIGKMRKCVTESQKTQSTSGFQRLRIFFTMRNPKPYKPSLQAALSRLRIFFQNA